jgi:acyl-CoA thioesterase
MTAPPVAAPPADLARDTAVTAVAPGRWRVELPDRWSYLHPSGGVVVTASLRAAVAELADPALRLASTTTVFPTPIAPGPHDVEVTVLRRGKHTAQVRTTVRAGAAPDAITTETLTTFCKDRPGPDVIGARFPDVALPAGCADAEDGHPVNPATRFAFYRNFDCRIASGGRYWLPGFAAGPPRYARWWRYRVPQRTGDVVDRLALPPIADTMPTALLEAIGPSAYRFFAPSLDFTLHVVDDTAREWLLVHCYCRRARAGWATAELEIWDDARRLVAYGTQAMYLHTLGGEPPVVDASGR